MCPFFVRINRWLTPFSILTLNGAAAKADRLYCTASFSRLNEYVSCWGRPVNASFIGMGFVLVRDEKAEDWRAQSVPELKGRNLLPSEWGEPVEGYIESNEVVQATFKNGVEMLFLPDRISIAYRNAGQLEKVPQLLDGVIATLPKNSCASLGINPVYAIEAAKTSEAEQMLFSAAKWRSTDSGLKGWRTILTFRRGENRIQFMFALGFPALNDGSKSKEKHVIIDTNLSVEPPVSALDRNAAIRQRLAEAGKHVGLVESELEKIFGITHA